MTATAKYFVDANGDYIGAFDGFLDEDGKFVAPAYPVGAVEMPGPPPSGDARQTGNPLTGEWLPFSTPLPVPPIISRRQFYAGLAEEEVITKAEALAAMKNGAVPAALQAIISGMEDADASYQAEMLLVGATQYERDNPLVMVFAITQGMTEAEVDDFWRLCHSL